ncbi:hypothetical protein KY285_010601 [Solanum tuberosum]|uniref:Uncharacterized protein n=1 Tax=Solanum tuberosum TaxID=4113 RepID=M1DYF6_SOLTU|nr:hypothetical protein KY285_010601 [Solanum tuberosum]
MGSKASTSNQAKTPKSNNKPCKKKREATKKKQGEKQDKNHQEDQEQQVNLCKKFMMVDDQQGMDITPLHAHYITPPPSVPPDKSPTICQINTIPEVDEYGVDNSEDEVVVDNQSLNDPDDDDDETSELLIKAFSPHNDRGLEEEIQQMANKQGLSPRGFHHDRFQANTNQDINFVTAGRPNTRLFTSRSSQ